MAKRKQTKKKKKKKQKSKRKNEMERGEEAAAAEEERVVAEEAPATKPQDLLSPELRDQLGGVGMDVIVTKRKNKQDRNARSKRKFDKIDPAILKQMRKMNKKQRRKLLKIQERKEQQKNRADLYKSMQQNAISSSTLSLLHSSGRLGQKLSRKEMLRRDLRLQRANVVLPKDSRLMRRVKLPKSTTIEDVERAQNFSNFVDKTRHSSDAVDSEREIGSQRDKNGDECVPELHAKDGVVVDDDDDDASKISDDNICGVAPKVNVIEIGSKTVHGVGVGAFDESRCTHWHTNVDRLALQAPCCLKFYACAQCHDECESHRWKPWKASTSLQHNALLCGACGHTFSFATYFASPDACETCDASFNPKCKRHWNVYFSKDLLAAANVVAVTEEKKEDEDEREKERVAKETNVGEASTNTNTTTATTIPTPTSRPAPTLRKSARELREESDAPAYFKLVDRDPIVQAARLELPMCGMEQELMEAVSQNDVVIVCGETGSGKTTQVPQFFYEAGYGNNPNTPGRIAVTQPRRVAAISTAQRVAHELNTPCDSTGLVAYQIRHQTSGVSDRTKIKFVTEGVLLQEAMHDVLLSRYSAIILDEAHERNTDTDVLLGLLSRVIPLRNRRQRELATSSPHYVGPLKLVIMSATLRVEDFTENRRLFSSPPPVIRVGGRQHSVTVHFARRTAPDEEYLQQTVRKVRQIHSRLPHGTVLVFLPGKREIEFVCKKLSETKTKARRRIDDASASKERSARSDRDFGESSSDEEGKRADSGGRNDADRTAEDVEDEEVTRILGGSDELKSRNDELLSTNADTVLRAVVNGPILALPLHAQLPKREQMRVFQPPPEGTRLVVVATNVAESSITIPGVRYVVDSGRARNRSFGSNGIASVSQFTTGWCTKASSDQRAGRAGRTGPGHAYRLYSSAVFDNEFEAFADPEIIANQASLSSVVLRLKKLHIDCVARFPFPTPPPRATMRRALKELVDLGLLEPSPDRHLPVTNESDRPRREGALTILGKKASLFPVDPRYGKMLVLAGARAQSASTAFALASDRGNLNELAVALVASMSVQDSPFRKLTSTAAAVERVERERLKRGEQGKIGEGEQDEENTHVDSTTESPEAAAERARKRAVAKERTLQLELLKQWSHERSDALAALRVLGASSGVVARALRRRTHALASWCGQQRLVVKTMREMTQLRDQLRRQLRYRLASPFWSKEAASRAPALVSPSARDERVLLQLVAASFVDRIARRVEGEGYGMYQTCDASVTERVYVHARSFVKPRGGKNKSSRVDAQYVAYKELVRSTGRREVICMRGVTVVDPAWLPKVAAGSPLLHSSGPLDDPPPFFDTKRDRLRCYVSYHFGPHRWKLPIQLENFPTTHPKRFAWFARNLLEGTILPQFRQLREHYRNNPRALTLSSGGSAAKRVVLILAPLKERGIDSTTSLSVAWRADRTFLKEGVTKWTKKSERARVDRVWVSLMAWADAMI